ncbi:hypothetical protein BDQ17DRAFT_1335948 [Cyathus striatus]|nr:hypothetical protein BDQ17DRAFT_1335948 [Cyathus striatus]
MPLGLDGLGGTGVRCTPCASLIFPFPWSAILSDPGQWLSGSKIAMHVLTYEFTGVVLYTSGESANRRRKRAAAVNEAGVEEGCTCFWERVHLEVHSTCTLWVRGERDTLIRSSSRSNPACTSSSLFFTSNNNYATSSHHRWSLHGLEANGISERNGRVEHFHAFAGDTVYCQKMKGCEGQGKRDWGRGKTAAGPNHKEKASSQAYDSQQLIIGQQLE